MSLPTELPDGRPAAWLRIKSHRALANVTRVLGGDLIDYASIDYGHIFVMAVDRLPELDALPRYCRGSVVRIKRAKVDAYAKAWT